MGIPKGRPPAGATIRGTASAALIAYAAASLLITVLFAVWTIVLGLGSSEAVQRQRAAATARQFQGLLDDVVHLLDNVARYEAVIAASPQASGASLRRAAAWCRPWWPWTSWTRKARPCPGPPKAKACPPLEPEDLVPVADLVDSKAPAVGAVRWHRGFPYIAIRVPVLDDSLRPHGSMAGTIEVSALWEFLEDLGESAGQDAFLLDGAGTVLIHRDMAKIGAVYAEAAGAGRGAGSERGSLSRGIDGSRVVGAWVRLPGSDWRVAAYVELAAALSPFAALVYLTAAQLCLSAAAVAAFGLYLNRRVLEPLRALSERARRYGGGDFDPAGGRIGGQGEIGILDEALDGMAADLKDLVSSLETKVEERTRDLRTSFERLMESERQASMARLVAGVAHQINTPIGNALTATSFLRTRAVQASDAAAAGRLSDGETARFLEDAAEAAALAEGSLAKAAELVRSFKRVAVGRDPEAAKRFDLVSLIADAASGFESELREAGVQLSVRGPPALRLRQSPDAVFQIVSILIQNSLAHAFEGVEGPRGIDIGLSAEGGEVELDYGDNGRGIPTELRQKVFEPFFTTKRGEGASGLGLAIVYALVTERLAGGISLESGNGRGCRFRVRFPDEGGNDE